MGKWVEKTSFINREKVQCGWQLTVGELVNIAKTIRWVEEGAEDEVEQEHVRLLGSGNIRA